MRQAWPACLVLFRLLCSLGPRSTAPGGRIPDPIYDASSLYIKNINGLEGRGVRLSIPERLTWREGGAVRDLPDSSGPSGSFYPASAATWTDNVYLATSK